MIHRLKNLVQATPLLSHGAKADTPVSVNLGKALSKLQANETVDVLLRDSPQ
jgi:hypothetical protein